MNRILIIGGTGNVGRQVLSQLPATGAHIRALVRDPAKAALPAHVDMIAGDLTIPSGLDACLAGIDTVFLVWNAPSNAVTPALDRILSHARRIVFLSAPYKTDHPFFQGAQPNPVSALHAKIEQQIESSRRQWTFLRPGMFAANALSWWAPQVRAGAGTIRWPHASAPTAPIHERDIAAVAVRALCDDGHAAAEYVLTGPQSLTQSDQLSIIGNVIGRPLRMEDISPEDARREWSALIPLPALNMLLAAWAAATGQPALVTSTVAEITGTPARTFRDWAVDHNAEFRG